MMSELKFLTRNTFADTVYETEEDALVYVYSSGAED